MTRTLFCLPPAGGSASVFKRWRPLLPPSVAVRPLDPPGRTGDPLRGPAPSLTDTAAVFAARLATAGRYALVGHSLGGLLAYETARRVCALPGADRPEFVVVAGTRPPHRSTGAVFANLLDLDDDALLDALADLGAVNPVLRRSPMRALFLPTLRADLSVVVGYRPGAAPPPLPVDLFAWHGTGDDLAPPSLGREWARYTTARFGLRAFAGGHFFPLERLDEVTTALTGLVDDRVCASEWRPFSVPSRRGRLGPTTDQQED